MNTILEINKILNDQNKEKNTKNIIDQAIKGGKHAFDVIQLVHETEIEFLKKKIIKLEERILMLERSCTKSDDSSVAEQVDNKEDINDN